MKGRKLVAVVVVAIVVPLVIIAGCSGGLLIMFGAAIGADTSGTGSYCQAENGGSEELVVETTGGEKMTLDSTRLANATQIILTGREMGISAPGLKVALMTALAESGLRMLANSTVPESLDFPHEGVGEDHDSVNPFQQRPSSGWGTVKELMDLRYATRAFFGGPDGPNDGSPQGLLDIEGWEQMTPGEAAQSVQVSKYPDAYDKWEKAAETIVSTVGGSTTCENSGERISADARTVAQQLVTALDNGTLSAPDAEANQIRNIANGTATADCLTDIATLQVIVYALKTFETATITSLNRRCTGETPGAGMASYHWKGRAVDFGALGGQASIGSDANSVKLIQLLDKIVPAGMAGVGQYECRTPSLYLQNFIQFEDPCTHLHIEIRTENQPLTSG